MEHEPIPVACTLGPRDAASQLDEWTALRRQAVSVGAVAEGARLVLPVSLQATVRDLAEREAACCAFLSLATTVVDGHVVLDITADSPDGRAVAALLAGTEHSADAG